MIKILKVRDVKTPTRANSTDSGIDFFVPNILSSLWDIKETPSNTPICLIEDHETDKACFFIEPWFWALIPAWIKTIIEPWYDLVFQDKSWVAIKWLIVWAKVIDSSYRWEIHLHLINTWIQPVKINLWQKVAQWIVRKVELDIPQEIDLETFEKNSNTDRWNWWFWSTWI